MKSGDPIVSPPAAKILIVDDERDLVEMLALCPAKKGYQIAQAYDGPEAWEKDTSGETRPHHLGFDVAGFGWLGNLPDDPPG